MRLLALTAACLTLAAVGAGTATAVTSPTRPSAAFNGDGTLTPDAWEIIQNPGRFPPPVPGDGLNQNNIDPTVNRARVRGRVLPPLKTTFANSVVLKSTVFSVAASLGLTGYLQAYQALTGDSVGTTNQADSGSGFASYGGADYACIKPQSWKYRSVGQNISTGAAEVSTSSYYARFDGWYLVWLEKDVVYPTACASPVSVSYVYNVNNTFTPAAIAAAVPALGVPVQTNDANTVRAWYATENDYEDAFSRRKISSDTYNTFPAGDKYVTNYTAPTPTGADKTAAGEAYGTPGTQTDPQKGAENALAGEVGGTTTSTTFQPFVIPQPASNETYVAYLERLRARGWLGQVTLLDDAAAYPAESYGALAVPGAVVELTVGTIVRAIDATTGARIWPANAPTITSAGQPVELVKRAGAPAETGGGGATTIPPAGGLDFTPITDLDPGCKFPYGLICYAVQVTDIFDVTPSAPAFTFDIPTVTVAGNDYGGGVDGWVVDLNVMDDFMGIMRSLISVVLWIGGVYFLAANLLGFRMGGDPGEAADEALNV